ncbi:LPS-assembly protein LptD [Wohlfahrtiimonas larvae]|uniref:LPS-assembly protein LptD n=1 Tax=Wohlfahrtiimonas larvae TaxID=1157986 RepID=A0ABP9MIN7_9GAMM|nr:LPS assembly protein LptD [Wohlfahrtiimonas larvae]
MAKAPPSGAFGACRISPLAEYVQPSNDKTDNDTIYLSGKYADSSEDYANIREEIIAYYGNARIDADHLVLDRKKNILKGNDQSIRYSSDSAVIESDSFTSYLNNREYEGENVTYYMHQIEAQGKARYAINRQNDKTSDFEQVTYSTCPVGTEVWQLSSEELHLDEESGRGIARHAKLSLFGVPVLYSPYFSFPIDDRRQSGFLFPMISLDKDGGFSIRTPYYLNIAPNFDMTLIPGFYTKRGLILGAEARYLNEWQHSTLGLEVLPHDRAFRKYQGVEANHALSEGNPFYKKDSSTRWSVSFDQQLNLLPKLRGRILFQQVSDDKYAEDIQDAVGLLTKTNLERIAELTYSDENWQSTLRFQHFQILDRDVIPNDPYARMPQLLFNGNWITENGIFYGAYGEAVNFTTNVSRNAPDRPKSAIRLDLMPYIGFRIENSWGFFEPKLAYRFTHYDLNYQSFAGYQRPNQIDSIHRSLPIFSIDTGVVLERDTQFKSLFGGGNFVQTLEPRLFYLYVPYRNQSNIPIFDTGSVTPSFDSLFATNQFTGADRQSNANQITAALTTRFINEDTGVEHLRLSAGQIYYIDDPRITTGKDLPSKGECYRDNFNAIDVGERCRRSRNSEWFVESNVQLTQDFSGKVTWQWSPDSKKTTRLSYDLRYQPEERKIINIGQRYYRDPNYSNDYITHQIDLTSYWEVSSNWAVVGRYNYSLEENKLNDSFVGFEYSDCCVATRVAARYYRNNIYDKSKEWKAYLQFELKGLGNFGPNTDTLWRESIYGYQTHSLGRNPKQSF